jgi:hypothetical protein
MTLQESRHPIIYVLIATLLVFGVVVVGSTIQKGLLGTPRIRPSVKLTGPFYIESGSILDQKNRSIRDRDLWAQRNNGHQSTRRFTTHG